MNASPSQPAGLKHFLLGSVSMKDLGPGLALALALTVAAYLLSYGAGQILPGETNPFSPILNAIGLGLIFRNVWGLPEAAKPGVAFGIKKVLRGGIILMGIRLSVISVARIGAAALGMVFFSVSAALILTMFLARRLGISDKLGTLIAAGTSICGVSAIVATSPTIGASEEETAYAIGTVTLFGIAATLLYPYLAQLVLGLTTAQAGFFLGTSIHDTSQVTGAALIYDQLWAGRTAGGLSGADIAITTKLVRNTFMIAVIPFLSYWYSRKETGKNTRSTGGRLQYVPFFILGYVFLGLLRTAGDGLFGPASPRWITVWQAIQQAGTYAIALAIACVGLNTGLRRLLKLGTRPMAVGLAAAVAVGLVSLTLVTVFESLLVF